MAELRLRKRHRMRQKEIESVAAQISSSMGSEVFSASDTVDRAEGPEYDAILVDGTVVAFVLDGVPFLTVRGILRYGASRRHVTVDMGAVRFVANGADVMGPGIVGADESISEGDLVWVRDERNRKPLAVGRALVPADAMLAKVKGKTVRSIHHVGDKLWLVDEEEEDETAPASPDQ